MLRPQNGAEVLSVKPTAHDLSNVSAWAGYGVAVCAYFCPAVDAICEGLSPLGLKVKGEPDRLPPTRSKPNMYLVRL